MSDTPWRHERKTIKCCFGCVPPKRHSGCHDTCKEYKDEKAEYLSKKKKEKEYLENHQSLSNYDFDKVRLTASRKK